MLHLNLLKVQKTTVKLSFVEIYYGTEDKTISPLLKIGAIEFSSLKTILQNQQNTPFFIDKELIHLYQITLNWNIKKIIF